MHTGKGVVKDHKWVDECYRKAVVEEDPNCWFNLGVYFERGGGEGKDHKWVAECFQKAAEGGHP
eukprot:CAMPEP_0114518298 /NCGR_PEP_ID=MMETSP0109-20121206/18370_1 /TAXON_ID=29199 /ORGANISM="Chlorarachnion reptans, Strain CCCM449" /LENGTH=63 /DNA_ID=CAMNT_0001698911 /DNA_START=57 /DNA_END=244 /DNA_ORIENTATION=+